jgi:putative heme-binding domain-containing protein
MQGDGANVGPDITGAAGRYSPRDLLLAILEPSREVPDVWRDTELWNDDELLAVGRVEAVLDEELVVRETSGASVHVATALVTERVPHRLSRMPEALLDVLERDEVLDLLAYVLAGGDPADERFR